jgi:hypothetical protein
MDLTESWQEFMRLATPVLFANFLTVFFVYGIISYDRMERAGQTEGSAGLGKILLALIPLLVMLYGFYLWGAFEATPFRHLLAVPH